MIGWWIFYGVLFFGIPLGLLVFLGISIYAYVSARIRNKRVPDTYSRKQMNTRLILLILSSVLTATLLVTVVSFVLLLLWGISYM